MKNSRLAALGVVCLVALTARVAQSSVTPTWSIDGLTSFARAVVTGRVVDVAVGRDPATDAIYTYVTVSVGDVLKGDIPERVITLKQLGGEVGSDGLRVTDQASFTIGEDVLLFLEARPRDGTLYTTALWQGKWTIETDAATGERTAARYQPDVLERGAFRGDPERHALSVTADRIRSSSRAAGEPVRRAFRASPPALELDATVHPPRGLRSSYALFSPGFRWNEFDTQTAIGVDVMSGGQTGLAGGGSAEVTRAFGQWTAVTPLSFFGAASSSRCFGQGNTSDGHISIVFMDPCGEIDDGGGTLAIGGASYRSSGAKVVGNQLFGRATAGYIVNNNSATALKYLSHSGCFQAIETHEIGHVLGLDHSADSNAIMYASLSSSCLASPARGLGSDDVAGIRTIYPPAAAPAPAPTPAPTPAPAPSPTPTPTPPGGPGSPGAPTAFVTTSSGVFVTMTWKAPTTGGTPTGYVIESGSAPGLTNIANFSSGSSVPGFSADKVGLGTYYVRVRAINAAGAGPVSNESILVVTGGPGIAAPGAPSGLTAKAVGLFVTISWKAPTTGGAPSSYILESGSGPGLTNIENFSTGSTATTFSADKVGVGSYYVRIRAANSGGVSAPSNEAVLVVR